MTCRRPPGARAPRSWVGSVLRHALWRTVWSGAGGLTVTGQPPAGPAILVANHTSHADAAAILAALPPAGRPVLVAAADYWFAASWRRLCVGTIVAALPVTRHRENGYAELKEAVLPALRAGSVVVVFPEGTRAVDDTLGRFHAGAVRLADDLDIPLVPAALLGTRQVLPKHGRFRPGPAEVRFGAAVDARGAAGDPDRAEIVSHRLRRTVAGLRDEHPLRVRESGTWRRAADLAGSRRGLAVAAGWGFAEALSWPVIAEMELAFLGAAVPRRTLPHAVAVALGSVAGVCTHVWVRRHAVALPLPMTTPRMRARAADDLAQLGTGAFWRQQFNGIPVKVYAARAAETPLSVGAIAVAAGRARGARIVGIGAAAAVAAHLTHPVGRRLWGPWVLAAAGAWAVAVRQVMRRWS